MNKFISSIRLLLSSFNLDLADAIEVVESKDASQRYWFTLGQKKTKFLSTLDELSVARNVTMLSQNSSSLSLSNPLDIADESENLEEMLKVQHAKCDALEEQIQNLEEKCQMVPSTIIFLSFESISVLFFPLYK